MNPFAHIRTFMSPKEDYTNARESKQWAKVWALLGDDYRNESPCVLCGDNHNTSECITQLVLP